MNAEDLNDICGRSVRGAPIDADHVLEIIADLTAARAELAENKRYGRLHLAAVNDKLVAEAALARVRELCDERDESARSVYTTSWVFVSDVLAAIEGNQP